MAEKILLIDDDKIVGRSLEKMLTAKGYEVTFVNNGEAAIGYIKDNSCSLIISDVRMPKLDGIDTIKGIREHLKKPVPEILITGYSDSESYQEAQQLKVASFIYKPFDISQITQAIDKALQPAVKPEKPLAKATLQDAEDFFGYPLPQVIKENCRGYSVFEMFDQKQIMQVIDFEPPFLMIDKMAILGSDRQDILNIKSVGMGILTTDDTKGHYNDTIFLAKCGQLMGESASVYLAMLFAPIAPQVVEVDSIRPSDDKTLWKPSAKGSQFFIETQIIKKKLHVVIVNVKITFGEIFMGEVEKLKLVLTPKESIWGAKELPI